MVAHAVAITKVSEAIRVLVVDCCRVSSQLLVTALQGDKRLQVLDVLTDVQELRAAVARETPAVVLIRAEIDGNAHKGFEVARELNRQRSGVRIVMLLESSERDLVVEAFQAGAYGIFCGGGPLASLAKCILCVSQGQVWASSEELRYLLEALDNVLNLRGLDARCASLLSRREREVVGCVADGLSNREIGQRLGLTEHTVKNHLFRIFDKLGVSKRVQVVTYAYGLGSVPKSFSTTKAGIQRSSAQQV